MSRTIYDKYLKVGFLISDNPYDCLSIKFHLKTLNSNPFHLLREHILLC